jgi:hypothetical protein
MCSMLSAFYSDSFWLRGGGMLQAPLFIEGALDAMAKDSKKDARAHKRNTRYQENKGEKQFTDKKVPLPLAAQFAKMYLGEEPHTIPFDDTYNAVFSIDMSDDKNALASQLSKYAATNDSVLCKKANNLIAKMKGSAAMTCKAGIDTSGFDFDKFGLSDKGRDLMSMPFLVALSSFEWTWHIRGWPLSGVACFVIVLKGRLLVNSIGITVLTNDGLKALVSLPELKSVKGPDCKAFDKLEKTVVEISAKSAAFLPAGSIPLVSAVPEAEVAEGAKIEGDKAVALVIPLLHKDVALMKAMAGRSRFLLKQYIEQCFTEFGSDKPFDKVSECVMDWVQKWAD